MVFSIVAIATGDNNRGACHGCCRLSRAQVSVVCATDMEHVVALSPDMAQA